MRHDPWNTHPDTWSEAEYLELGETLARVELVDGCLLISPTPDVAHQRVTSALLLELHGPAESQGLLALPCINVRVGAGRILNPDLALIREPTGDLVVDAGDVVLVGEVGSASSTAIDRSLKMRLYADGGIGWYLLARPVGLELFQLDGGSYRRAGFAAAGSGLVLEEPVPAELTVRWPR